MVQHWRPLTDAWLSRRFYVVKYRRNSYKSQPVNQGNRVLPWQCDTFALKHEILRLDDA